MEGDFQLQLFVKLIVHVDNPTCFSAYTLLAFILVFHIVFTLNLLQFDLSVYTVVVLHAEDVLFVLLLFTFDSRSVSGPTSPWVIITVGLFYSFEQVAHCAALQLFHRHGCD